MRCVSVLWVYLAFNMLWQLGTYHTNKQSSTVPGHTATVPPPMASQPSAHDTLGLAALSQHNDHQTSHQSLALELDTYLNDLQKGTNTLIYWQVWINLLHSILLADVNTTGKPSTLSYSFPSHYGYPTYPRLICSMWTSVLVSQRDHGPSPEPHEHKNDGGTTDS